MCLLVFKVRTFTASLNTSEYFYLAVVQDDIPKVKSRMPLLLNFSLLLHIFLQEGMNEQHIHWPFLNWLQV